MKRAFFPDHILSYRIRQIGAADGQDLELVRGVFGRPEHAGWHATSQLKTSTRTAAMDCDPSRETQDLIKYAKRDSSAMFPESLVHEAIDYIFSEKFGEVYEEFGEGGSCATHSTMSFLLPMSCVTSQKTITTSAYLYGRKVTPDEVGVVFAISNLC